MSGPAVTLPYAAGYPFACRFAGAGGTPPYRFSAVGALPAGVALAADGSFGGNAASGGTFTVRATDARGLSGTQDFTIASASADPSARPLLTQSDFTYLGYYDLANNFGGSVDPTGDQGGGLTGRYRAGKLRFMSFFYVTGNGWRVGEFDLGTADGQPAVTGGASGGTLGTGAASDFTNYWDALFNAGYPMDQGASNTHLGLWWDEPNQKLWTTFAHDYPDASLPAIFWADSGNTLSVMQRTLNLGAPGSVSNLRGAWGVSGRSDINQAGGVLPVPSWFQSAYCPGKPYLLFGSGYGSLGWQRVSSVALVKSWFAVADPNALANGAAITSFVTLADESPSCAGNTSWDWFTNLGGNTCYEAGGRPTSFDRTPRNTNVNSDFDQVSGTSFWKAAAPDDSLKRCTWGDAINGCLCWVDGPNKNGVVMVLSGCAGNAFYNASQFQSQSANQEFQVYDPKDLGKVALGTKQGWALKPTSRWLSDTSQTGGLTTGWNGLGGPDGQLRGAWYDSSAKRLYAISNGGAPPWQRLYCWSVNA